MVLGILSALAIICCGCLCSVSVPNDAGAGLSYEIVAFSGQLTFSFVDFSFSGALESCSVLALRLADNIALLVRKSMFILHNLLIYCNRIQLPFSHVGFNCICCYSHSSPMFMCVSV